MSRPRRIHGVTGEPRHHDSISRLPDDLHRFLERLVKLRSLSVAARELETTPTTLDRALGPGLKKATRDRLEASVRKLIDVEVAKAVGAEVLS